MIIVRFPGPVAEDFEVLDEPDVREAIAHAGRLALVTATHVGDDPEEMSIGERGSDPRIDLRFSDGWRWTSFLNEVDVVTKARRLTMEEMLDGLDPPKREPDERRSARRRARRANKAHKRA